MCSNAHGEIPLHQTLRVNLESHEHVVKPRSSDGPKVPHAVDAKSTQPIGMPVNLNVAMEFFARVVSAWPVISWVHAGDFNDLGILQATKPMFYSLHDARLVRVHI